MQVTLQFNNARVFVYQNTDTGTLHFVNVFPTPSGSGFYASGAKTTEYGWSFDTQVILGATEQEAFDNWVVDLYWKRSK